MSQSKGPSPSRKRRSHRARAETPADEVAVVNGYALVFHELLLDQLEILTAAAAKEARGRKPNDPAGANTKLVAKLVDLIYDEIPQDPGNARYRQGDTLGDYTHWRRAKFGNGRFRLFFRYRSEPRIIVFAWVNDDDRLRTYGSRTDAYRVFASMLDKGNPPDDWDALLASADALKNRRRMNKLMPRRKKP